MKHTLLGAGGSIAVSYAHELLKKNEEIRLVSRSGHSMDKTEVVKADLTSYSDMLEAVKGSDIVYLFAGLPYDKKIWAAQWPVIMKNCIDACKKEQAKFVFFDNVYMYGKVEGKMTENTPHQPSSKKGEIRARIAEQLMLEYKAGNLNAIIARAADLYGPYITKNSIPYSLIFERLYQGKKAQCLASKKTIHSYTYTLDCARGLSLLVNDEKAFNQIWHLPTDNPPPTTEEFMQWVATELNKPANLTVLKKWMVKLVGSFDKTIKEVSEMLYQNEYDYYFDSTKFNEYFSFKPTPYEQGIKETAAFMKNIKQ